MMRHASPHHSAARGDPLHMDDRKPSSCMDQFDRLAESEPMKDSWIEKLGASLLTLMNSVVRRL